MSKPSCEMCGDEIRPRGEHGNRWKEEIAARILKEPSIPA